MMVADKSVLEKYQPTIGIECHVQLKTDTKLFARVSNDAREAEPNTTVSPICFGLPGVLPYLNEGAIELAVRAGLALNAQINPRSTFDRKHYFYPDLPKGYQITQYAEPIVGEGYVEVPTGEETVRVGIERAHLEEDAGKLTHPGGADYSLVDLNRAGTPLLEIVSKPDIKSPAIAKAYVRELYLLMKYADVSDVDLYHGHMRFDVNISVALKGSNELGTRAEVKNINSFRAVEKAAQFEFERQVELLEKGEKIIQETRGWNEDKSKTFSQRSKEEAHDYRYFPEPDLPPVEIEVNQIAKIKSKMPVGHQDIRSLLGTLGIDSASVESLLDYPLGLQYVTLALDNQDYRGAAKHIAYWVLKNTEILREPIDDHEAELLAQYLFELAEMRENNLVGSTAADEVFVLMIEQLKSPKEIAQVRNLIQVSDEGELSKIVEQVIKENPQAAKDVKNGEAKAIGFLVGQVMKLSKGQANPKIAQDLLKKKLEE